MKNRNIYIFYILFTVVLTGRSTTSSANQCGWAFDNFTSPVCTDAKYIFWTGTAITAGLSVFRDTFITDLADQTVAKDHLGVYGKDLGKLGDGYLNGSYILLQLLFGGKNGNKSAELMFEASLYSFGVTQGIKSLVNEARPGYPDDYDSFPSGHSAFSFAFASVVSAQHGLIYGIPAHMLALAIAFSRMDENWHYLHDVVAGITIGASYGWGVYLNHSQYKKPYWIAILPGPTLKSLQLSLAADF